MQLLRNLSDQAVREAIHDYLVKLNRLASAGGLDATTIAGHTSAYEFKWHQDGSLDVYLLSEKEAEFPVRTP